jgi:hypothetical protein
LFDVAELGKSREQLLLRGLEAEITDKNLAHGVLGSYLQNCLAEGSNSAWPTDRCWYRRKDGSGIEVENL